MLFKVRRCVDTKSKKPNYHAILNYALFVLCFICLSAKFMFCHKTTYSIENITQANHFSKEKCSHKSSFLKIKRQRFKYY